MFRRLLAVVAVLTIAAVASAASQRLGLAPTGDDYHTIPANGTKSVPCYCLDRPLKPPAKGRQLHPLGGPGQPPNVQVAIGDKWVPLGDAITQGKVALEASGRHSSLVVRNRTDGPIGLW